jgi:hypothetical protein
MSKAEPPGDRRYHFDLFQMPVILENLAYKNKYVGVLDVVQCNVQLNVSQLFLQTQKLVEYPRVILAVFSHVQINTISCTSYWHCVRVGVVDVVGVKDIFSIQYVMGLLIQQTVGA